MGLTCSCNGWDIEPGMKLWSGPCEYTTLQTQRRKRCCSCNELIEIGATCAEVSIMKVPETLIEVRIYGEDGEVPMAQKYMCERCADLSFSLEELGYCPQPWEDQRELIKDYATEHAPQSKTTDNLEGKT